MTPRHRTAPTIAESGFDGELSEPVQPETIFTVPVDPAPLPQQFAPLPQPTMDPAVLAFMQLMQATMLDMRAELTALKTNGPALVPDLTPEQIAAHEAALRIRAEAANAAPAAPVPTYKLYFTGERRVPADGVNPEYMIDDLQEDIHDRGIGPHHACGRFGDAILFKAETRDPHRQDLRCHAYISRGMGDWLIQNDRAFSPKGHPTKPRYEWSPEALEAFQVA